MPEIEAGRRGGGVWRGLLPCWALAVLLGGCGGGGDMRTLPEAAGEAPYRLAAGDAIHVTVFGEAAMSGDMPVDAAGTVSVPLVGAVAARGHTAEEVAGEIAARLRTSGYLRDPNVTVTIREYRPVFLLGEVQHPGAYAYHPHMSFLGGVAQAGGFTPRAVKRYAEVVRGTGADKVTGRVDAGAELAPGDVVVVQERSF